MKTIDYKYSFMKDYFNFEGVFIHLKNASIVTKNKGKLLFAFSNVN